jgi:hypothetical protein
MPSDLAKVQTKFQDSLRGPEKLWEQPGVVLVTCPKGIMR